MARPIGQVMRDARPQPGPLPVISARPLKQGDLFSDGLYGSGTIDPTRTGTDPSVVARLRGQLQPYDPGRLQTAAELAAMFVPGPKGGRFVGALTPEQKRFMNQLQGIVDHQQIPGPPGHGGTVMYPEPIWERTSPNAMKGSLNIDTAGSREIAEKLGYVGGDALSDLLNSVHRQGDSFTQTYGKLGATEGGTVPSWVTTASELKLWGMYKHDPSHLAALAGMKDDVRAALAQIIDTINRRGPGGPGLSGYGAN
jgi:hypothetical protein